MREVCLNAAEPRELEARFVNDFVSAFWSSLDTRQVVKLKDHYYEINRALSKAIEDNIKTLGAEYYISLDTIQAMKNDEMHKHYALDHISRIIAKALLDSKDLAVEIYDDWQLRARRFRFAVPFIVLKKTPSNESEG